LLIGVEAKPEETKGGPRDSSTGLVEAGEGQANAQDEAEAQAAELQRRMNEDTYFQVWLTNVTGDDGVRNIG
jgi:hypothetical protein